MRTASVRTATFSTVATNPDRTIQLTTIDGETRSLDDWTTTFHLCLVILPSRPEASAYVPAAERIFSVFSGADCRTAYLVVGNKRAATRVLGEAAGKRLVYCDPDGLLVKSLGLHLLPALAHLRQDTSLAAVAEGWQPKEWNAVTSGLAKAMSWTKPMLPGPHDPAPFDGWSI